MMSEFHLEWKHEKRKLAIEPWKQYCKDIKYGRLGLQSLGMMKEIIEGNY